MAKIALVWGLGADLGHITRYSIIAQELITRGHEPQVGCLAFPGGHIDYNESPQDACVRELREECGIEGTAPELVDVRGEPDRDARKHMISIVYKVEVEPDAEVKAGDDAATAEWYNIRTLMQMNKAWAFDHQDIFMSFLMKHYPEQY